VTVTTTPRGVLTVSNDGPVLDPAKVRTFTEPFTRAARLATRQPGQLAGHGLGLALVSAIVDAHHGTLDLTANPTGGLTVTVKVPVSA
jgi:signal transduction histidine kinase